MRELLTGKATESKPQARVRVCVKVFTFSAQLEAQTLMALIGRNPQFHPDDLLLGLAGELLDLDFVVAIAEGAGRTQLLDCAYDAGTL